MPTNEPNKKSNNQNNQDNRRKSNLILVLLVLLVLFSVIFSNLVGVKLIDNWATNVQDTWESVVENTKSKQDQDKQPIITDEQLKSNTKYDYAHSAYKYLSKEEQKQFKVTDAEITEVPYSDNLKYGNPGLSESLDNREKHKVTMVTFYKSETKDIDTLEVSTKPVTYTAINIYVTKYTKQFVFKEVIKQ